MSLRPTNFDVFVKGGGGGSKIWYTTKEISGFLVRNAIDAHAQGFVTGDYLLLLILKVFAKCSRSLHAVEELGNFQFVRSSRTVCRTRQW